jgi:hypothetical protein
MGLLDDMKDKAGDAVGGAATGGALDGKANEAVDAVANKVKEATSSLPGGEMIGGLIDKAKGMLDGDGDGDIDMLDKLKNIAK